MSRTRHSRLEKRNVSSTRVSDRGETGQGVLIVERRGGRKRGKGGQIRESREKKKGGRDCNLLNLAAKRDS